MQETYLVHHGIKGQKWGVRRYQNPDGTLTAEGERRYVNNSDTFTRRPESPQSDARARYAEKVDRGRLLRETGKTKSGVALRGLGISVVSNTLLKTMESMTIGPFTRRLASLGIKGTMNVGSNKFIGKMRPDGTHLRAGTVHKAFLAGRIAVQAINWAYQIRDISAMSAYDKSVKEEENKNK